MIKKTLFVMKSNIPRLQTELIITIMEAAFRNTIVLIPYMDLNRASKVHAAVLIQLHLDMVLITLALAAVLKHRGYDGLGPF